MATLTNEVLLADLHKGMASLTLLPYNSTNGAIFNNLDFSAGDVIITLKDTFSITPSAPTTEEIKIDQKDQVIDTTVEKGEYKMAGQIPSNAVKLFDFFMEEAKAVSGIKGQDGKTTYSGKSYFTSTREVECSVLVESASTQTAIAFARVKFVIPGVTVENASTPAYLAFDADILANAATGEGDFAILKGATSAS